MLVNDDAQMDLVRDLIAEDVPVPEPHALMDEKFDLASLRVAPPDAQASAEESAPITDAAALEGH